MVILVSPFANLVHSLVHDPVDGDMSLVHFRECQPSAIGRPPEAAISIHLFPGDIFRQAMRYAGLSGAARQLQWLSTGNGRDPQLRVLDVSDRIAIGREPRIEERLASVSD